LQTDLMNAMPYLVPVIIPLKDLLNLVADIEKEIKGSTVQAGKSNEELLREYLSGSQELLTDQTVQDSIDTHDTMQVEETATSDTDGTQGVS
jgi:L-cysteine desulfidase